MDKKQAAVALGLVGAAGAAYWITMEMKKKAQERLDKEMREDWSQSIKDDERYGVEQKALIQDAITGLRPSVIDAENPPAKIVVRHVDMGAGGVVVSEPEGGYRRGPNPTPRTSASPRRDPHRQGGGTHVEFLARNLLAKTGIHFP